MLNNRCLSRVEMSQDSLFANTLAEHDPGGRSKPKWRLDAEITARFGGPNNCYRYMLRERWDETLPAVMWLCMNPSTATLDNADPTLMKTGGFARRWGYGAQYIANVHAYRATDSIRLLEVDDPVGPENDAAILSMAEMSALVVLAYGKPKPKALRTRGPVVTQMLRDAGIRLAYLRMSADGTPWHPLYLPGDSQPIELAA